jgi:hypothetical protein
VKSLRKKSRHATAGNWPDWTDDHRYVPTEAEERAASESLNDLEGHRPLDDEFADLDRKAAESEAQDQLERGLRMF